MTDTVDGKMVEVKNSACQSSRNNWIKEKNEQKVDKLFSSGTTGGWGGCVTRSCWWRLHYRWNIASKSSRIRHDWLVQQLGGHRRLDRRLRPSLWWWPWPAREGGPSRRKGSSATTEVTPTYSDLLNPATPLSKHTVFKKTKRDRQSSFSRIFWLLAPSYNKNWHLPSSL